MIVLTTLGIFLVDFRSYYALAIMNVAVRRAGSVPEVCEEIPTFIASANEFALKTGPKVSAYKGLRN